MTKKKLKKKSSEIKFDPERSVEWRGPVDHEEYGEVRNEIMDLHKENSEQSIDLFITSPGGSVTLCFAFYDFIQWAEIPLHTYALGHADSASLILFLSGQKRFSGANTFFIVHDLIQSYTEAIDLPLKKMRHELQSLELLQDQYIKIVLKHSNKKLDKTKLSIMMREETIVNAEQALEWGWVHGIL